MAEDLPAEETTTHDATLAVGRDCDGGLVAEAAEQAAIGRMRVLRGEGLSLRAIRDRLAEEGVRVSHVAVGNAPKAQPSHPRAALQAKKEAAGDDAAALRMRVEKRKRLAVAILAQSPLPLAVTELWHWGLKCWAQNLLRGGGGRLCGERAAGRGGAACGGCDEPGRACAGVRGVRTAWVAR